MNSMAEKDLIQVMDPDGKVDESAVKDISKDDMLKMYRLMSFTRLWNSKALSLQRQGRLGTLASVRGQEAANVGMGMALNTDDWFVPAFREYGAMFARGANPVKLFQYWGGDERGARPPDKSKTLPVCITVGSHLCHAVGLAYAAKLREDKVAVMSSSGDGSTSQGDFHEALNFAAVYKLPVVFVIQNNHWAISVPLHKQTVSETLAVKSVAYGMEGVRVDGNDVFGVYLALKEQLAKARDDFKPSLVELVTYRMDDHTTSDDASRYRTEEMMAPWRAKDPIDRLRKYLTAKHDWDDKAEKDLQEELTAEVEKSVEDFEAVSHPNPEDMFDHVYAEMPWHLKEQKDHLLRLLGKSTR
jgi:pyruvate dehydrogenase E1 component alpha subunit